MHVELHGESLEEVGSFIYLGLQVAADGGCERDVLHKINEGYRAYRERWKLCWALEDWG